MQHYPIQIFWSDEDNAFIAIAPDLEGCSAGGTTEIEALQELQIAMELWLEAAHQIAKPIPQPASFNFIQKKPIRNEDLMVRQAHQQTSKI
jgi:predicted RNase H-like HicB family nuclease